MIGSAAGCMVGNATGSRVVCTTGCGAGTGTGEAGTPVTGWLGLYGSGCMTLPLF